MSYGSVNVPGGGGSDTILGNGAPTGAISAEVGQQYFDRTKGTTYICVAVNNGVSQWEVSGAANADEIMYGDQTLSEALEAMAEAAENGKHLFGTVDPTPQTKGAVGQTYYNTVTGETFTCNSVNGDGTYTWEVSGGGGGGGLALAAVTGIQTIVAHGKVYVKWTDPEDLVVAGATLAAWSGTLLVRKAGSAPTSRLDGTVVLDSKTRNAYKNGYFCDSGLTDGTVYYYKLFPYTNTNAYTDSADNAFTATPAAVQLANVTGKSLAAAGNGKLAIRWTDPAATVVQDGVTVATWACTKIVVKEGGYASSPDDSAAAFSFTSNTRNAYANTDLIATGLRNGTTYYVSFFPVSTDGAVNANSANRSSGVANRMTISTAPSQSGSLTYNGGAQSPSWSGYDSAKMTLGGTTSATNAGSYNATFTPKDDYMWSNGSTGAKTVSWSIGKAAGSLSINKTSLTLDSSNTVQQITVTRAGDGAITAESSDTSVATVSVSGNIVTVTSVNENNGTATITIKVAAGTNHTAPSNKTCSVTATFVNVFGVCWNYNNSSTACTRLTKSNDPNGYVNTNITTNPSPAVGTGSGSSPFDSFAPWKDMDEYNIVNNAVGAKKGASGFSRTSNDVVVLIPEYYYKIVDDSANSKRYFYIADKAKSGFTKHPGSGKYVGRYHTINSSGYYSRSGAKPVVNMTRATARTNSKNKGSKWSQYDFAALCAIQLLYLVEFADWDSQSKIGKDYTDGNSAAINTGGTDSMTYHTGRASGTDGKVSAQYRHIENLWGNVLDWVDGINFNNKKAYVCTDPSKYADDTATGYTDTGVTLPSSGWIKKYGVSSGFPWALIPDTSGGSETTYVPDYVYSNSGWCVLFVGGNWSDGTRAGLFCFLGDDASSYTSDDVGARLLFHP